tara:strand:+ start:1137 stop:1967 length:831 start_codon:yes stop_codon:yes gene_type:complete
MKPGLYIVSTPIGNLDDIGIRAQKTLVDADIIICENPKHSSKLLSKLGIKKKLYSLHDYNENKIISKVENYAQNKSIALISDAGSPLISDPGYKLVNFYINQDLNLTTIPGPSAVISSLQLSGMPTDNFKFHGFIPKTKRKIETFIDTLSKEKNTSIFFVSSHRLLLCLGVLEKKLGNKKICLCKELTKINERVFRDSAKNIVKKINENKKYALGEFVIIIGGNNENNSNKLDSSTKRQIEKLLRKYSLTDVVEIVHKLTNISKKIIYNSALEQKK